jgi:hypothetical protein
MDMIELFEFIIFVLALGFIVFSIILMGWDVMKRPLTLLVLLVAVVEWMGGLSLVELLVNKGAEWSDNLKNCPPYEEIEHAICYDYDLMNPLTVVDKLRGKMGRKRGIDLGSLESLGSHESQKDQNLPVPDTNFNELLGGDDFEHCLEAYAAKQQNQRGGFRVFQQDLKVQEKLLEAFGGDKQTSQGNFQSLPEGLNPYQLIENNAEAYKNWTNDKDGLAVSRNSSVGKSEDMLPENSSLVPMKRRSSVKKDNFFVELIQNYAEALQDTNKQVTMKDGDKTSLSLGNPPKTVEEASKPANQTLDDIDIKDGTPREGGNKNDPPNDSNLPRD